MDESEQLRLAIAAQEILRGSVPDEIVDATIVALEQRLAGLTESSRPKRRRHITVLFADLSGYTAMAEGLDPEAVSHRLDALWNHLDAVIDRFGGRIDKHIGDAVMGLWGADQAREDDPERAVRAALAMQAVLADLREEGDFTELMMRIGINTGPVVLGAIASTDEFTATGDTVNVAARLEQAAPAGEVLVGHDTYRHVRGVFTVRAQAPLAVKGRRALLRTYLVDGIRPRAFRLPSRGIEGVETSMVGRHVELEALKQALARSIDASTPISVLILGEAGVGKSRLLYEFEDWLRVRDGEVRLFSGRADHGRQGVPYSLLRDLFFTRFEIAEDDPAEIAQAKLTVGFRELATPEHATVAPIVGRLIGIETEGVGVGVDVAGSAHVPDDPRQLTERAAAAISRFFSDAAERLPIVLLVEDLHWADRASLDLIARVRREAEGVPILFVALCRPGPGQLPAGWDEDDPSHVRVVLGPLSPTEIESLVDEVFQKLGSIPPAARSRILVAADGNPFFVEELVRMMVDEGIIMITGDEWAWRSDRLGEPAIPATVTGVIQARLDRLSGPDLSVLQRAAVVGSVFWDAAIPTLPSDIDEPIPSVGSALDRLVARDLIERRTSSAFNGTVEYRFRNAILHEVTYQTVLLDDRRAFQRAVADWMVERTDGSASADTIARQYASGAAVLESAQWFARAAKQARLRSAVNEAIDSCRSALEPDVLDDDTTFGVLDDLYESLTIAARYDEALTCAQEMTLRAEQSGDGPRLVQALLHQSHVCLRTGRSREALGNARRANELARGLDSADDRLESTIELGWVLLRLGDADEAIDLGTRALEVADPDTSLRCLRGGHSMLGAAHLNLARYPDAERHFTEALAIDRRRGDRRGEAANLVNLGEVARLRGELTRSIAMMTDALSIVREIGDRDQEALVRSNLGGALVEVGDTAAGMAHLAHAVAATSESGGTEHASETHRFLAEAHLATGDVARARLEAQTAMELARHDENPDHLGHAWRVLGLVAAGDGRPVSLPEDLGASMTADDCLQRSASVFASSGMNRDLAVALINRSDLLEGDGDRATSAMLRRQADEIVTDLGISASGRRTDETTHG